MSRRKPSLPGGTDPQTSKQPRMSLMRWIRRRFRRTETPASTIYDALRHEEKDPPLSETIAKTFENPSLLLEHIEALRAHLLRSLAALVVGVFVATFAAPTLLDWLSEPIGGRQALQAIEVTESIGVFMRISLMAGFTLSFPYIAAEFYAFLHPGLRRNERRMIIAVIPAALFLFLAGLAFAYLLMLPTALRFLLTFLNIPTNVRPASYIRFVTGVMFWMGVAFQFPLIIYVLARLGILRANLLRKGWRFAIVGIAVLAAAVTPTIDPVNMALVMGPMILLYFLGIGLASLAERQSARPTREA